MTAPSGQNYTQQDEELYVETVTLYEDAVNKFIDYLSRHSEAAEMGLTWVKCEACGEMQIAEIFPDNADPDTSEAYTREKGCPYCQQERFAGILRKANVPGMATDSCLA